MGRRYYRRKSILKPSKLEKQAFYFIINLIKMLTYIIIGVCKGIYDLGKYVKRIYINHYKLKEIGYDLNEILDLVYKISPRQFEIFTAELFRQHGHKVRLTAPTSDYGRDVIVDDNIFIECKKYSPNGVQIGREICQKILGSVQMFRAEKAIIITTGKYHKNAYEVASMVDNLQLMDITDIQKMILDLKPEQISKVIMRTLNAS